MKYRIEFIIDVPTNDEDQVLDWAEFELGFNSSLSRDNPCSKLGMPMRWENLQLDSLLIIKL